MSAQLKPNDRGNRSQVMLLRFTLGYIWKVLDVVALPRGSPIISGAASIQSTKSPTCTTIQIPLPPCQPPKTWISEYLTQARP